MTHHHPYIARILTAQRLEELRRPTRDTKREFADFLHIVRAS